MNWYFLRMVTTLSSFHRYHFRSIGARGLTKSFPESSAAWAQRLGVWRRSLQRCRQTARRGFPADLWASHLWHCQGAPSVSKSLTQPVALGACRLTSWPATCLWSPWSVPYLSLGRGGDGCSLELLQLATFDSGLLTSVSKVKVG